MDADGWDEGTVYYTVIDKQSNVMHGLQRCWHMGQYITGIKRAAIKDGGDVIVISPAEYTKRTGRRA